MFSQRNNPYCELLSDTVNIGLNFKLCNEENRKVL